MYPRSGSVTGVVEAMLHSRPSGQTPRQPTICAKSEQEIIAKSSMPPILTMRLLPADYGIVTGV